jgi:hypothetical protein
LEWGGGELALALMDKFSMVNCRRSHFGFDLAPSPLLREFTNINPETSGASLSFFETMVRKVRPGKC